MRGTTLFSEQFQLPEDFDMSETIDNPGYDSKRDMMITAPVGRLICKLAIPTIIIQLVSAMHNMADAYFVSFLGTSATAAVGVSFSLMNIIQAVGIFFGPRHRKLHIPRLGCEESG
jgi:hypothetical protein